MRGELRLTRAKGDDIVLAAGEPMSRDDARQWLDEAFIEFDCEPVRATSKVLAVDKVAAIAQAARDEDLKNAEWSARFASAALTALGRDGGSAVIDLETGRLR